MGTSSVLNISPQVFGLTILFLLGWIEFPTPSWSNMMAVQPLPIIQVFNVACGLVGTKLVSIPMFTYVKKKVGNYKTQTSQKYAHTFILLSFYFSVLRRVSIPMTLLAEVYILTMPTTKAIVASVVLLMLGSMIAAANDLSFNLVGYTSILISAVCFFFFPPLAFLQQITIIQSYNHTIIQSLEG